MEACVLPMPKKYSKYLFYSSFSLGASCLASIYFCDYQNAFTMCLLFLTSIQYWHSPDIGFRRNLDMFMCKVIMIYYYAIILYAREEFYFTLYLYSVFNGAILYLGEQILVYFHSPKWIVLHMAMHVQFAMMIPFILYIL